MNQLIGGFTFIISGSILLLIHARTTKAQKENTTFQTPYLKNGGIGFVLIGLYFLVRYFYN